MNKPKPLVKWVGGKRQLLNKLIEYMPKKLNKNFTYYEPFVGGAALLFELTPKNAVINDINQELVNVYRVMCDEIKYNKMLIRLRLHQKNNNEDYYYKIRSQDRNKRSFNKLSDWGKAARTIYLNKTCFNGLYRVNRTGHFNVPYNGKEKVVTYDLSNIEVMHEYFKSNKVKIFSEDFELIVQTAKKGDLVYFDPPYDPIDDKASFTSYTKFGFNKDDQIRLSKIFNDLSKKGVYVMASNHNTILIRELYKDFNIHIVDAKRMINSDANNRGNVEEVIITNYE